MFVNMEQGKVFLNQTDFEVAEQLRQEYMSRHHISDRKGGVGEYLASDFEYEVADEGLFALDGFQAVKLGSLARESQSYHFGRYKKYSQDHERMTVVSERAISEPGIAKVLDECIEHMDTEAAKLVEAKKIAEQIETIATEIGIPVETSNQINS